jgi:hypothetical protein
MMIFLFLFFYLFIFKERVNGQSIATVVRVLFFIPPKPRTILCQL